jgi:uncharacterized RDD family membrane protein YckC
LIDAAVLLVWILVVGGLYFGAAYLGWVNPATTLLSQVVAGTVVGIPALLLFAAWEAGARQGTVGKRHFGLRVHGTDGHSRVSVPRAFLRNALKIAAPVLLLHLAAMGLVSPGVDSWILAGIAVALPGSYLVCMFIGSGRTPYDLVAGTQVTERAGRVYLGDEISDVIESKPRRAL